jgi:hypothetical protein
MMKICKTCNNNLPLNSFEKNRSECKQCRNMRRKKTHKKTCLNCGSKFFSAKKNTVYCSHECHGATRIKKVTVNCSYCGKEKDIVPSLHKRLENFYCNQDCRTNHLKTLMEGENNPNYNRINVNCSGCNMEMLIEPFRVKHHKYQFCSFECYKNNIGQFFEGENNPLWNGSLSSKERIKLRALTEYRHWRKEVYERDNYTCQCCSDNSSGNLNAHHLYSWDKNPEIRFDVNNGITLCKTCHKAFHDLYGYGNNTKEQFEEYKQNIFEAR